MAAPKDDMLRKQPELRQPSGAGQAVVGFDARYAGLPLTPEEARSPQERIWLESMVPAFGRIASRAGQTSNIRYLSDVASGRVESQAMKDIKAQSAESANAIRSLASSTRGTANVLQSKNVAQTIANQAQQDARTMAQLRAQEILTYNQMLANQINNLRAGDLGIQSTQMNISAASDLAEQQRNAQILGGALQGVGAGIAQQTTRTNPLPTTQTQAQPTTTVPSDKELKKEIKSAQKDIKRFMDDLKPYKFRYKDEKHGKGEQVGIMAQDMEKSESGKTAVMDMPEGKMIDLKKSVPLVLASIGDLNKRLKELEGGNG